MASARKANYHWIYNVNNIINLKHEHISKISRIWVSKSIDEKRSMTNSEPSIYGWRYSYFIFCSWRSMDITGFRKDNNLSKNAVSTYKMEIISTEKKDCDRKVPLWDCSNHYRVVRRETVKCLGKKFNANLKDTNATQKYFIDIGK